MYRFTDLHKIAFDVECEPYVFRIGCYECIRMGKGLVEHKTGNAVNHDCTTGGHVWFVQACLLRMDTYQKTLQGEFTRSDGTVTDEYVFGEECPSWGFGGKIPVSPYMAHGEIVKKFLVAALGYGEHEVREAFQYKGRRIFGPHIDVDALWDIAEHTETREKMRLNPGPLKVGDRDPVAAIADPTARVPKCETCGNVKAFCECKEFRCP